MSSRHIPGYFDCVMHLHKEKMDCFLELAETATPEEKNEFEAYDVSREVEATINRFAEHPEEKEENLPLINQLIFGGPYDMNEPVDVLIVLGSRNCGYKAEQAFEIGRNNPNIKYIVSGGNPHKDGLLTEAKFMADYLRSRGVAEEQIYLENRARYTKQNLLFSNGIVHELDNESKAKGYGHSPFKVGIVTAGFHIKRTQILAAEVGAFEGESVYYFPAYGPTTHIDTWFDIPVGRAVVLEELRKTTVLSRRAFGIFKDE